MLEMRPACERCSRELTADSPDAFICSYECTFCRTCAESELRGVCPNCSGVLLPRPPGRSDPEPEEARMQRFETGSISPERWVEFLRVPALSAGIYRLSAGETDLQQPHSEDEVYYVVSGNARFRAGDETCDATPGVVLYVPKRLEHRFFDISSDLTLLVFFAPPEGSTRT
jgi:hypothetical protein